jgi:hypothetical protein
MELDYTSLVSYALRRLSGNLTRRNAQALTGAKKVDMVRLKQELMGLADSLAGSGDGSRCPLCGSNLEKGDGREG